MSSGPRRRLVGLSWAVAAAAFVAGCSWPSTRPAIEIERILAAPVTSPVTSRMVRPIVQTGHQTAIQRLAFSPSGQRLVSLSTDGMMHVWDVERGALIRTHRAAGEGRRSAGLEWDFEQAIVTGDGLGQLVRFELDRTDSAAQPINVSTEPVRTFVRLQRTDRLAWAAVVGWRSLSLLFFGDDWHPAGPAIPLPSQFDSLPLVRMKTSLDGLHIGILAQEYEHAGTAVLVTYDTRRVRQPQAFASFECQCADFVMLANGDVAIRTRSLTDKAVHRLHADGRPATPAFLGPQQAELLGPIALSADGRFLIAGFNRSRFDPESDVARWDVSNGTFYRDRRSPLDRAWTSRMGIHEILNSSYSRDTGPLTALAVSPDGRWMVGGTSLGHLSVRSATTGRFWTQLGWRHPVPKQAVFLDGDGLLLLAEDHLSTWSLKTGALTGWHRLPAVVAADRFGTGFRIARSGRTDRCWGVHFESWMSSALLPNGWTAEQSRGTIGSRFLSTATSSSTPSMALPQLGTSTSPSCFPPGIEGLWLSGHNDLSPLARGLLVGVVRSPRARFVVKDLVDSAPPVYPEMPERYAALGIAAVSRDGRRATGIVAGPDGEREVGIWELPSGRRLPPGTLDEQVAHQVDIIAMSDDGVRLAASSGSRLAVSDLPGVLELGRKVTALAVGDADVLAGSSDGSLEMILKNGSRARGKGLGSYILRVWRQPGPRHLAVTSSTGGAVQVWDIQGDTPRPLVQLAMFDDDEWLALTPEGAFAGTLEAAERIGWEIGGTTALLKLSQYDAFWKPQRVQERLAGVPVPPAAIPSIPPVLTLLKTERDLDGRQLTAHVRIECPRGVATIHASVEGRPLVSQQVHAQAAQIKIRLPLLHGGPNQVSLLAFDDLGFGAAPLTFSVDGSATSRPVDLWVVAVGISRYPQLPRAAQLRVASDDAAALINAMQAYVGPGRRYARLHSVLLQDEQANPDAIRKALGRLKGMQPSDLALVLLAGHGVRLEQGAMVFLTHRATDQSADALASMESQLSWDDMAVRLSHARGRVLLLLDACHAGSVTPELFASNSDIARNLARAGRAGVAVFAASKGWQKSAESPWNGRFTGAFLSALASRASDLNGDGELQLTEIVAATAVAVDQQSHGLQSPWLAYSELIGDFSVVPAPPPASRGSL